MIEMLDGGFNQRLDAALNRVDAGEEPARAAGLNWSMASLQPLLQAAAVTREIPIGVADAPVKTRVRNRFMAQAAGKRVAWVHQHSVPLTKARRRPQVRRNPVGSILTFIILAILAVTIGTISAFAAGFFGEPDSPLYPLKLLGESTLSTLTRDPVSKADLQVTFAGQRLREAEAMAGHGRGDLAVEAVRVRYDELRQAAELLKGIDFNLRGPRFTGVRDRFETEEGQSVTTVEQALTNTGNNDAAQQVQQLASAYQNERRVIDKELVTPQESPKAPTPAPKR